jgi:ribose transport system permease protein
MAAIGFTIVLICGELDLSFSSVMTLGGVFVIGFQPQLGWAGSLVIAILAGGAVGLVNGLLVTKVKINSFMVTLGMMIVIQGLIFMYGHGESVRVTQEADLLLADFLDRPIIPFLAPRVLITIFFIVLFDSFMKRTSIGRNMYAIGGNRETAWLAGIRTDLLVTIAFILSGLTASLGGILFAMSQSSAFITLGEKSLMIVISAVIIGGTSIKGGSGGIIRSGVAVLTLTMLYNGLNRFGVGSDVRVFANGLVLAVVVLYEAYALYRHDKFKGQRKDLLGELTDT